MVPKKFKNGNLLTIEGFKELGEKLPWYEYVHGKYFSIREIMALQKVMVAPYYFTGKVLFYFDPQVRIELQVVGDFNQWLATRLP